MKGNKQEYIKEFYTLNDLSTQLGISIQTLRKYISDGKLKASFIGKQYIIDRSDIKDLLNNNKCENTKKKNKRVRL